MKTYEQQIQEIKDYEEDTINAYWMEDYCQLNGFPNCCGIVVLESFSFNSTDPIKLCCIAVKLAMKQAYNERYRYIVATDVKPRTWQILEACGFAELSRFRNAKTGRMIRMYGRALVEDRTPIS